MSYRELDYKQKYLDLLEKTQNIAENMSVVEWYLKRILFILGCLVLANLLTITLYFRPPT